MRREFLRRKQLFSVIAALFVSLVILEVGSLFVLKSYMYIKMKAVGYVLDLDLYEQKIGDDLWGLRPGSYTLKDIWQDKRTKGHKIGERLCEELAKDYKEDETVLYVNKFGFRGKDPEEKTKREGIIRILIIGDSCTFGLIGRENNYPEVARNILKKVNNNVELINAGVEGYSTREVLKRLDYFLEFSPDIVCIYIGWNDIYTAISSGKVCPVYISYLRYSSFYTLLNKIANKLYSHRDISYQIPGVKDGKYFSVERLSIYPFWAENYLEILERLKKGGVKKIVLITLPHIFSYGKIPSDDVLSLSHLPHPNAYRLVETVRLYNDFIREVALKEGAALFDLDVLVNSRLSEKQRYFIDTLHPNPQLHRLIGGWLASFLIRDKLLVEHELVEKVN